MPNRITGIHIDYMANNGQYEVTVAKEFAAEHGGGFQTFKGSARTLNSALNHARDMIAQTPVAQSEITKDGAAETDLERPEGMMSLKDVQVLVCGDNGRWAQAPTLQAALKDAGRPKRYIAYACHPDTKVDGMGYLLYPEGFHPQKIVERGLTPVERFLETEKKGRKGA